MATWVPSALRRGNLIYLTLPRRRVAAFQLDPVTPHRNPAFGRAAVYGYTLRPLRLVTCEGIFDSRTRHCLGHVVVSQARAVRVQA